MESLVVKTAGVALRLVFADLQLEAEFADRFGGTSSAQGTEPVLTVLAAPGPVAEAGMEHAVVLDGCGEYLAWWDTAGASGRAWITGESRSDALANLVRRLLRHHLLPVDALVLHASCMEQDGWAYVFAGPSGAGKTTVCRGTRQGKVLSDDMTVLRCVGGRYMAWGFPGPGATSPGWSSASPVPVRALLILAKCEATRVMPLPPAVAAAALVRSPVELRREETMASLLVRTEALVRAVPCFELCFSLDGQIWPYLLAGLEQAATEPQR